MGYDYDMGHLSAGELWLHKVLHELDRRLFVGTIEERNNGSIEGLKAKFQGGAKPNALLFSNRAGACQEEWYSP